MVDRGLRCRVAPGLRCGVAQTSCSPATNIAGSGAVRMRFTMLERVRFGLMPLDWTAPETSPTAEARPLRPVANVCDPRCDDSHLGERTSAAPRGGSRRIHAQDTQRWWARSGSNRHAAYAAPAPKAGASAIPPLARGPRVYRGRQVGADRCDGAEPPIVRRRSARAISAGEADCGADRGSAPGGPSDSPRARLRLRRPGRRCATRAGRGSDPWPRRSRRRRG